MGGKSARMENPHFEKPYSARSSGASTVDTLKSFKMVPLGSESLKKAIKDFKAQREANSFKTTQKKTQITVWVPKISSSIQQSSLIRRRLAKGLDPKPKQNLLSSSFSPEPLEEGTIRRTVSEGTDLGQHLKRQPQLELLDESIEEKGPEGLVLALPEVKAACLGPIQEEDKKSDSESFEYEFDEIEF